MNNVPGISERLFAADYIPAADVRVLSIRDKTIATLCNYVVYSGLPKTGKSTFISALIASAYVPYDIFGQKLHLPANRQKIALFDTEMSPYDLHKARERIRQFADTTIDMLYTRLDIFSMREDSPPIIRQFIENYLAQSPQTSIVIIDGFLDLCMNYNDEIETRMVTNWLKRITKIYDIAIVGILHLGKNQGETVGHLGSNTDRWAQSTMIIRRNRETQQLTLESKFLRSSDEFEPVAIMYDNDRKKWIETELQTMPEPTKKKPGRPKK